ncbi:hypothetical protein H6G74_08235 [Nostoc spongiaeforme FACHB-130]|uniref:Uncharacterized protein n=1 Tax=Nostoc spongiaeforme FACHB-130 TaxID=1357510 RepID=A0ABR8FSP5_9NOSO|nr:hypothetical protein [Nostoc spongiaeforme FACHB-130]
MWEGWEDGKEIFPPTLPSLPTLPTLSPTPHIRVRASACHPALILTYVYLFTFNCCYTKQYYC